VGYLADYFLAQYRGPDWLREAHAHDRSRSLAQDGLKIQARSLV
jgi:hypothetical protein